MKKQFYECGFKSISDINIQINLNFVMLCIFLILYDIEFTFLFPILFKVLRLPFQIVKKCLPFQKFRVYTLNTWTLFLYLSFFNRLRVFEKIMEKISLFENNSLNIASCDIFSYSIKVPFQLLYNIPLRFSLEFIIRLFKLYSHVLYLLFTNIIISIEFKNLPQYHWCLCIIFLSLPIFYPSLFDFSNLFSSDFLTFLFYNIYI